MQFNHLLIEHIILQVASQGPPEKALLSSAKKVYLLHFPYINQKFRLRIRFKSSIRLTKANCRYDWKVVIQFIWHIQIPSVPNEFEEVRSLTWLW